MTGAERPEWLPEGWTATGKKRSDGRRTDWTYIDSSTGSRLYSKAAVFRYLESEGLHTPSPNKEGRIIVYSGADTSSSQRQSVDNKFNNNTEYSSSPLPDGWIKEFKLRKAGSKVKKELIVKQPDGQVTRKKSSSGAMKPKPTLRVGGPEDSPKWLPSGWITEIRTQQSGQCAGHWYKCFFDPVTETRFHSKRKVLEYLASKEIHSPLAIKDSSMETKSAGDFCSPLTNKETSMETESAGDICTSSNQIGSANNKVTIKTSSSLNELPDGWIKEVRPRQSNCGVKMDPYYIDPVSGYEFRSRKDAWRYIKYGDVRMCINRPRKRPISDVYSIENEGTPPSNLVHMRKETEIQPSHGEGIFVESAREKTLHETEVNTSQRKKLVVIRKLKTSASRVRRKGRPRQKLGEKKQVDSQRQGSAAQLRPRKTKPFKTITPPTRSSQRLAAKNKRVVDPPEGPTPMAIVDVDFLRKLEVEGPPTAVEETKASGDRPDDIQNHDSAGETKSFEAITQPDPSLEQLPPTEANHVVDNGISDTPSQTMPTMPEILPLTPEQGTVQSSEKADEPEAAPTVNQDEQEGTLQSSVKVAEEQKTLLQDTSESSEKTEAAEGSSEKAEEPVAVPAVVEKLEVQEQAQTVETKPSFDTPDSPLIFPFGDSWSDPCLEFAFKTLTGDIPLEDTTSIENYFQQQVIQSPSLVLKPCVHHPAQEGSSDAQANGLRNVEYQQGK